MNRADPSERRALDQALHAAAARFYDGPSLPFKARADLARLAPVNFDHGDESTGRTAAAIALIITYCDVQPDRTFVRGSGTIHGSGNEIYEVGPESGVLSQLLTLGSHRCAHVSGPLSGAGAEDAVYRLDLGACRACLVKHDDGRFTPVIERLDALRNGAEDGDHKGDGQRRGRGGPAESEEHRRLKFYVQAHPDQFGAPADCAADVEKLLKSGDEIDVFCSAPDEQLAIEVKSRRSTDLDLERGIYQCVKYRAVLEAEARWTGMSPRIRTRLVSENELTQGRRRQAESLGIVVQVFRPPPAVP